MVIAQRVAGYAIGNNAGFFAFSTPEIDGISRSLVLFAYLSSVCSLERNELFRNAYNSGLMQL